MDNLEHVKRRTELQQIREFLLNGCEGEKVEQSYERRLKNTQSPLQKFLEQNFKEENKRYQAENLVNAALGECEDVFFEQGMQAGAQILLDLLRPEILPD